MCLLLLVHRFVISLGLTGILNIKSITSKWSLWDAEVAKGNKGILKSDNVIIKGSNIDLLVVFQC